MPIYQYDCGGCGRRVDVFFRSISHVTADVACPECGSAQLTRALSAFAHGRSEGEAIGSIDFEQELGRLETGDERGFARWARQLGDRYDHALGTDFGALAERTMAGEDPADRADPAFTLKNRVDRAARRAAPDSADGGTT